MLITLAQDTSPFRGTPDFALATNAVAAPNEVKALLPVAPTPINSLAPALNFLGVELPTGAHNHPPDTDGAVGPNHVVTLLNGTVRIQDRLGNTNSTTTLSNWWNSVGPFADIYDPKVAYDTLQGRWVAAVVLNGITDVNSAMAIAVSTSSDPTSSWIFQRIDVDSNNYFFIDRTWLGFNRNWIVVSYNTFKTIDHVDYFDHPRFYVFNKTNLYAGVTNSNYALRATSADGGGNVAPAMTYDSDQNDLYCARIGGVGTERSMGFFIITGSPSQPGYSLPFVYAGSQQGSWAKWILDQNQTLIDSAPQTNTTAKIRANDDRFDSVVVRNGCLWASHTIFLPTNAPTRSAVQWWQYDINQSKVIQTGRIDDNSGNTHFAYSSIAVNKYNDVLIGFTRFSTAGYASAAYAFRASVDYAYAVRSPYVYKSGDGIYYRAAGNNRWGDYSSTVVDPANDTDFWTLQEYAATPVSPGTTEGNGRWGTWWAKVTPPVPANDNFANASEISGGDGSSNGILYRATKETGEPNHAGISTYTRSIWYKWTAPTNRTVSFNAIGGDPSVIILLAIYTGTSVTNLTAVASVDGAEKTKVSFTPTTGATYRIALAAKFAVTDGYDSTTLNWAQPSAPYFVTDPSPVDNNVVAGDALTLASLAVGSPSPTYRWYKNTNTLISGVTSASLTFNPVQLSDQAIYNVTASNSVGVSTSAFAKVWTYTNGTATFHSDTTYLTNGALVTHVSGVTNHWYSVKGTTNYTNWVLVSTNQASFNLSNVVDTNIPLRVFRVDY